MITVDWVERAVAVHTAGQPLALLFDFDGTLAPIVPRPNMAALPLTVREALATLSSLDAVHVGVASSRSLATLKDLVGLPNVWYAGSGGMQLDLGGEMIVDTTVARFDRVAAAAILALCDPLNWFPGTWVERKPGCLAVHFRALAPAAAMGFVDEARYALGELAPGVALCVREVARALDVTLAGAWTKGHAVDWMLGGWHRGSFAVYAGDGANDEEAVATVNARGGLTIGIGPEAPLGVQVRVPTQTEFAAGLVELSMKLPQASERPLLIAYAHGAAWAGTNPPVFSGVS